MTRNYFYLVGVCLLVAGATGCASKHWDGKSAICKTAPKAVESAVAQDVKAAPVEPVALPAAVPLAPAMAGYHFGDHKSVTLTTKAWQALADKDTDGVVVYTNKCIGMYSAEAVKMQASLKEYPSGDPQKIFSYWALNDVATSLFIQGEAYRKAGQMELAKAAYQRVINEFSYGQAYDPETKTFWKPADAAKDGVYMIEKGLKLDFGNMTSATIVGRMWESLANKNLEEVIAYNMKLQSLYGQVAKDMQATLKEYPQLPAEQIYAFWALNDVGTGMFILGEAYHAAGMKDEAIKAYASVSTDYLFAQCWDPQGWFWKVAEAAQQKVIELESQQ